MRKNVFVIVSDFENLKEIFKLKFSKENCEKYLKKKEKIKKNRNFENILLTCLNTVLIKKTCL